MQDFYLQCRGGSYFYPCYSFQFYQQVVSKILTSLSIHSQVAICCSRWAPFALRLNWRRRCRIVLWLCGTSRAFWPWVWPCCRRSWCVCSLLTLILFSKLRWTHFRPWPSHHRCLIGKRDRLPSFLGICSPWCGKARKFRLLRTCPPSRCDDVRISLW